MPRAMLIMPKVAMKGGIRKRVTRPPLRDPTTIPTTMPPMTDSQTGTPQVSMSAVPRPASAIVEPTDRSMPAVRTTSVSPKAAMAIHEKDRSMLKTLVVVRKVSVAMVKKRAPDQEDDENAGLLDADVALPVEAVAVARALALDACPGGRLRDGIGDGFAIRGHCDSPRCRKQRAVGASLPRPHDEQQIIRTDPATAG